MNRFVSFSQSRPAARKQLDPAYFIITTEGIDEIAYFYAIEKIIPKRFNAYYKIHIIERENEHDSALIHVYNSLNDYLKYDKKKFRDKHGKAYIVFDHDNNFSRNNITNTLMYIRESRQKGYVTIYSNPCFDLWLLLHYIDVTERADINALLENKNNYVKRQLHMVRNGEDMQLMAHRYRTAVENASKLFAGIPNQGQDYPSTALLTEVYILINDIIDSGLLER